MFTVDVKQQCNNNNKSSSSPEQKNESGINGLSMRWYWTDAAIVRFWCAHYEILESLLKRYLNE